MNEKYRGHLLALTGLLYAASPSVIGESLCDGRVTDQDQRIVPYLAKPDYLQSYQDPVFGTDVTRISDAVAGGVIKTMYNTVQAWNIDESRLILYHTGNEGAGHHLYDGQTYEHLGALDIGPADIEEVFWDPKNREVLYYVQNTPYSDPLFGHLVKYNVFTDEKSSVIDLKNVCDHPASVSTSATSGGDVQAMQGDHIGLRCKNNAIYGNTSDVSFFVNVRDGSASDMVAIDPTVLVPGYSFGYAYNIAMGPTPSNNYVVLQDSVYDVNMNFIRHLDTNLNSMQAQDGNNYPIPNPEHKTIGSLPNGNDAMYTLMFDAATNGCDGDTNGGVGSLVAYDIETGACDVIIGQSTGWGYPLSGTHLSAISTQNPGWVTMSSIGYYQFDYFSNNLPAPTLFSEVSLTYADPDNPETCRLAHTRTYAKDAENTDGYTYGYFGEPHPVMSPSGTRILFTSDWYDSGSVDTYVIELDGASSTAGSEVVVDFEEQTAGNHTSVTSQGFEFTPTKIADVIIRNNKTNAIQPRWNNTLNLAHETGEAFSLASFGFKGQWSQVSGTVSIIGLQEDGTTLTSSFDYTGTGSEQTKTLNWDSLSSVRFVVDGTLQLDNFVLSTAATQSGTVISFENIAVGNHTTVSSAGLVISPNKKDMFIRDNDTHALQPRWNDTIHLMPASADTFDLNSFDYRAQWAGTSGGTLYLTGEMSNGTTQTKTITFSGDRVKQTEVLGWSGLVSLDIGIETAVQLDDLNITLH